MLVKFGKPFEFEGETFESIDLDLDGLRGSDITEAYRLYASAGNFSPMVSTDPNFCSQIAASAASKPLEFIDALPAPDFIYVTQAVQNFLLSSGLVNQDQPATSEKPATSLPKKAKQA